MATSIRMIDLREELRKLVADWRHLEETELAHLVSLQELPISNSLEHEKEIGRSWGRQTTLRMTADKLEVLCRKYFT